MNFLSIHNMLRAMLSVKSPTYDMVNCGLHFMIKSVMCVSFLPLSPWVLVPKRYSCVPRVMSSYHDNLSQAMIYRAQSVM